MSSEALNMMVVVQRIELSSPLAAKIEPANAKKWMPKSFPMIMAMRPITKGVMQNK